MLYKQFVAWNCNGCSIAPLTDYIHNPNYQELPEETAYFTTSDESIYLDLRASMAYMLILEIELKNPLKQK